MVGLSLVAAVAILTILSFTIFSNVLRSASQTTSKGSSSITGGAGPSNSTSPASQQSTQLNPKLVCSAAVDNHPVGVLPWRPTLDWSSQGQISVAYFAGFKTFAAQNCSGIFSKTATSYLNSWSPDGKKLLTVDEYNETLNILDSHGNALASLSFARLGTLGVGNTSWSSDSTKLIFVSREANNQYRIKSADATTGNNLQTLMTLPANSGPATLSPDGKFLLLEQLNKSAKRKDLSVWNVSTGMKASDIPPFQQSLLAEAFSPDGSLLALGGNNMVQIYTTSTGKLLTSFQDQDASAQGLALVWSPNGKYLAESSSAIHIYDVNAQQTIATFNTVDTQHWISTLAWAPDNTSLVSSISMVKDDGHSQTPIDVWKLN